MLKTAENCGVSAVAVLRWSSIISCRGAEADSHGPVQKAIEILLQYIDKVVDVLVVPVQLSSAVVKETAELPQLPFLVVWTMSLACLLVCDYWWSMSREVVDVRSESVLGQGC